MSDVTKGNCLCGGVKLEGKGVAKLTVCHCEQCRRWTGGAAIGVMFDGGVTLTESEAMNWYPSSPWAERGFCKTCGSSVAYRIKSDPTTLYAQAGIFDIPPGNEIAEHIFVDSKPDYYEFADDSPRLTAQETMAQYQAEQSEEIND